MEQLVARADHLALVRRVDRSGLHVGPTGSVGSLRNGGGASHLHPIAHVYAVSDVHSGAHLRSRTEPDTDIGADRNLDSNTDTHAVDHCYSNPPAVPGSPSNTRTCRNCDTRNLDAYPYAICDSYAHTVAHSDARGHHHALTDGHNDSHAKPDPGTHANSITHTVHPARHIRSPGVPGP